MKLWMDEIHLRDPVNTNKQWFQSWFPSGAGFCAVTVVSGLPSLLPLLPETYHLWESTWKISVLLKDPPCQVACWEGSFLPALVGSMQQLGFSVGTAAIGFRGSQPHAAASLIAPEPPGSRLEKARGPSAEAARRVASVVGRGESGFGCGSTPMGSHFG